MIRLIERIHAPIRSLWNAEVALRRGLWASILKRGEANPLYGEARRHFQALSMSRPQSSRTRSMKRLKDEGLCERCFDLLELDGRDLRKLPLVERKALRDLLIDADDDALRHSEEVSDPLKIRQVANKMGLKGIVSKRANQPYKAWRTWAG